MPLGAILGGVASVIGSAINSKQQDRRQAEALKAQQEENQKNRDWQERMWQEHESPQAQVQNMRAAGLNPMGQVSSQSVGSASTASLPTPQPSTIGDGIAQAGQLVASGLQARKALQLQRDQFNQQVTEQNRRFLLDLKTAELTAEEKRAMINAKLEEIEGMKIDNETKRINKKMLEDFADAGGNTYKDESASTQASTALTQAQKEFTDAQTAYQKAILSNADRESKARVTQMLASARASLASAYESNVSAQLKSIQAQNLSAQEEREKQLHVIRVAADEYARDLGATQADLARLQKEMEERWSFDIPVIGQVMDFIHHNLNLSGSLTKTIK